jgi:hypothetical protein
MRKPLPAAKTSGFAKEFADTAAIGLVLLELP